MKVETKGVNNMLERLKKVIKETMPEIDVDKINMDSRLKEDLGLDSIGLMMLSLSLEEEFNFQFEDAVMFLTVQDVVSFLEKNGK